MSYTAPQYVDTKEQAVLALASTIAGEDKTALGNGSVNKALDVLADVLAQQDVSVPQTNAGAILALAQYASGMVKPEGTITITENGEGIDVAQYATADVSVSGGGSSTQTLTVTKNSESDTVSVTTQSWADYIAGTGVPTEIQPDSIEGLVNTYSIPVGAAFSAHINNDMAMTFLNAEMTVALLNQVMPSTPLYATNGVSNQQDTPNPV